jgi:hypothetical protein
MGTPSRSWLGYISQKTPHLCRARAAQSASPDTTKAVSLLDTTPIQRRPTHRETTQPGSIASRTDPIRRHVLLRLPVGSHLSHRIGPAIQLVLAHLVDAAYAAMHVGSLPYRNSAEPRKG